MVYSHLNYSQATSGHLYTITRALWTLVLVYDDAKVTRFFLLLSFCGSLKLFKKITKLSFLSIKLNLTENEKNAKKFFALNCKWNRSWTQAIEDCIIQANIDLTLSSLSLSIYTKTIISALNPPHSMGESITHRQSFTLSTIQSLSLYLFNQTYLPQANDEWMNNNKEKPIAIILNYIIIIIFLKYDWLRLVYT